MVLVLGKGESGNGAAELLARLGMSYEILDGDDSTERIFALTEQQAQRIEYAVLSPGIPPHDPRIMRLQQLKIRIISEIEFAAQNSSAQTIAITGTNGKSTTTALIHHILKHARYSSHLLGNIGTAYSRAALSLRSCDVVALEVSSFQLSGIESFHPHIACILNITPDHLDYHGDMDSYVQSKLNITLNQNENDFLILSADAIPCKYLKRLDSRAAILFFSTELRVNGAYLFGDTLYCYDKPFIKLDEMPILGRHNVANVLAATLACVSFGIELPTIAEGVKSFLPLAHRMERVGERGGKIYINDSKATNIEAAVFGVRSLDQGTVLIAGGSDKGYGFDDLFSALPAEVEHVVVYGATADKLLEASERVGYHNVIRVQNLNEAVSVASQLSARYVLLSPACASFDQYKSYAERGEHFRQLVLGISGD